MQIRDTRILRLLAAALILTWLAIITLFIHGNGVIDILQPAKEYRAKQRQQIIETNMSAVPAPAFGPGWYIVPRGVDDATCQNLDVEKVMRQMAAAEYHPDLDSMDTYALCVERGFRPMLWRESKPTT